VRRWKCELAALTIATQVRLKNTQALYLPYLINNIWTETVIAGADLLRVGCMRELSDTVCSQSPILRNPGLEPRQVCGGGDAETIIAAMIQLNTAS
jgi:hypothetical protein